MYFGIKKCYAQIDDKAPRDHKLFDFIKQSILHLSSISESAQVGSFCCTSTKKILRDEKITIFKKKFVNLALDFELERYEK